MNSHSRERFVTQLGVIGLGLVLSIASSVVISLFGMPGLLFVVLCVLGGGLLCWLTSEWRRHMAVYILAAAIVFDKAGIIGRVGGMDVSMGKLAGILVAAAWAIEILQCRRPVRLRLNLVVVGSVFYLIINWFSAAVHSFEGATLSHGMSVLFLVASTLAIPYIVKTRNQVQNTLTCYSAAMTASAALVIAQYVLGRDPLGLGLVKWATVGFKVGGFEGAYDARGFGTFHDSNYAAFHISTAALYTIYVMLFSKGRQRWLFGGMLLVLVGGLFATFSRGGLLGLVSGLGWMVLRWRKSWHSWLKLAILLILVLVAVLVLLPQRLALNWLVRLSTSVDVFANYGGMWMGDSSRLTVWRSGIEMWKFAPLLGVGPGQWITVVPGYWLLERDITAAHSIWISVLAETGALGMLTFSMICIGCVTACWGLERIIRRTSASSDALQLVVMVEALFIGFVIPFSFLTAEKAKILWLMLGLLLALDTWYRSEQCTELAVNGVSR
jgi:O-antigen ligase